MTDPADIGDLRLPHRVLKRASHRRSARSAWRAPSAPDTSPIPLAGSRPTLLTLLADSRGDVP